MGLWLIRVTLRGGGQRELVYNGKDHWNRDWTNLIMSMGNDLPAASMTDDFGKSVHVAISEIAAWESVDYTEELAGLEAIARMKIDLNAKMQRAAAAKAGMLGGNGPLIQGDFRA